MRYSYLGESGLVVSRLGFGAMTFATEGGMPFAKLDKPEASTVMSKLLDAGVNLLDTADAYSNGQSETILGELIGDKRNDVIIVTKGGARVGSTPNEVGLSARHLHMSVEKSLKRLGTDWIDVYLCHLPDTRTPLEETLLALDQIVRSGKVRYIGFSNWPAWLSAKAKAMQRANNLARFVTGQYQYNLLDRDIESEIIPCALDSGDGIIAFSPLASGLLSGKYSEKDPSGGGGRLSQISLLTEIDHETAVNVVGTLRDVAQERNVPVSAIALAWVTVQPAVSTVLMGINRIEQLEANLEAADLVLSSEEVERLGRSSVPKLRYPFTMLKSLGDGWTDPRARDVAPAPINRAAWAPD